MEIDAPCPHCDSPGTNRIWQCGSIMLNGEVHQTDNCKYIQGLQEELDEFNRHYGELAKIVDAAIDAREWDTDAQRDKLFALIDNFVAQRNVEMKEA